MGNNFSDNAWEQYCYWLGQDKKTIKRINDLLKDISRNGNTGIGNPEPLKNMDGYWSREINKKDRLVYKVEDSTTHIIQCRSHYGDH